MVLPDAEARARAQAKQDEKEGKRLRAWEDAALNSLLATGEGRQFIWWLLTIGKFGTQPYAGSDAATNFNCGELNVGQQIFDRVVETNPQGYLRMIEDQNARERSEPEPDADSSSDT